MFFALIVVLALIGFCALAARRFGLGAGLVGGAAKRRLALVETLALDARRRAAILRCDGEDHLLILGPAGETIIARMNAPEANTAPAPHIGVIHGLRSSGEARSAA